MVEFTELGRAEVKFYKQLLQSLLCDRSEECCRLTASSLPPSFSLSLSLSLSSLPPFSFLYLSPPPSQQVTPSPLQLQFPSLFRSVFARLSPLPHLKPLRDELLVFMKHFLFTKAPSDNQRDKEKRTSVLINERIGIAEQALRTEGLMF